jgi:endoglucanase
MPRTPVSATPVLAATSSSLSILLAAVAVAAPAPSARAVMTAGDAPAAGNNMVWNGSFGVPALRPWTVAFQPPARGNARVVDGELCFEIAQAGNAPLDVVLRQRPFEIARGHRYQLRLRAHATAATRVAARLTKIDAPYTEVYAAEAQVDSTRRLFTASFEPAADASNVELAIDLGGALTGAVPVTVCVDDVELDDPKFEPPPEAQARPRPSVRVNQIGYLPGSSKIATVVSTATAPLAWSLVDAGGQVRASGKTRPFGADRSSGESLHQIDFSTFAAPGHGYKLRVGDAESVPFDVGRDVYRKLKYDALSFFYLQRSGIPIQMPFAGARAYVRPAGHVSDKSVPCAPAAGCSEPRDVRGGWYDAGDHGKYVVNGGLSVWLLQNLYETLERHGTAASFADGTMNIPEHKNGKPDLLDEARWELEFILRMQVPAGQPRAGMTYQKIHSERWTDLPTAPDHDPVQRYVRPVSTAATLNLAAVAGQGARLWRKLDPAFSARCLAAAEAAFEAARANPHVAAEGPVVGGGAYGDGDTSDELYWAAAELFITTGKPAYRDAVLQSKLHRPPEGRPAIGGNIGWDHVEGLAKMSLAIVPNALGEAEVAEMRRQVATSADRFLETMAKRGYRTPLVSESLYIWGSNAAMLDAAVVLGSAYAITADKRYANGVVDVLDYILGKNPMVMSYVAGHGTYAMRNPHHRVWAHQKDAKLPEAPPGAVSLGPNSMLQDPYIRKMGMAGCPPQTCYVDNIESYSTNEVAINSNAALAWTAAFLDDLGRP